MNPLRRRMYADNFDQRAREQKQIDGWKCVQCGTEQYTIFAPSMEALLIIIDPTLDHPKMCHLHAAHPNDDPHNENAELMTLCPSCHGRRDYRRRERDAIVQLERFKHMIALYGPLLDQWSQQRKRPSIYRQQWNGYECDDQHFINGRRQIQMGDVSPRRHRS